MKITTTTRWGNLDWGILIASIFLILVSLATLFSLELNQESSNFDLLQRQGLIALVGAGIVSGLMFFDFRHLKDYAYVFYSVGVFTLILVLIFGVTIRGTTGWFQLGQLTFQPVELFKIFLIVTIAKFFSRTRNINNPFVIVKSLLFMVPPVVLIYLQPDVGSLLVLIAIWFGFLIVLKLQRVYILSFLLVGLIGALFAWQFFLAPYQKERITTFINPTRDIAGAGYNVYQSKIAIGSGRLWGRGLGLGTQSSLNFLPEQRTDFIFAVISESLGLVGGGLVVLLYSYLLWRILVLAHTIRDEFGVFLVVGIFFWFAFQGLSNIAMNLGLAPVFGVPLPLVSYGGSSLIVSLIAIGILESVSLFSPRDSG